MRTQRRRVRHQRDDVSAAGDELLRHMQRFAGGLACRHRTLSEYFGQTYPRDNCGACDVCLDEVEGIADATVTAQKILSCVARAGEGFGVMHIVDILAGAEHRPHPPVEPRSPQHLRPARGHAAQSR